MEYILILGFIGLVSLAGFRAFGESTRGKAEEQAKCVETLDCAPGSQPGSSGLPDTGSGENAVSWNPFATGNPQGGKPPKYDGIKGGKDAKYEPIKGPPTLTGTGDGNAVHPNDVSQGQIGDCYLMSAIATIAMRNPDVIKNAIKDNGDGTFTVTFYEKAPMWKVWDGGYHKVEITVNNEFPSKNGSPVFAQPGDVSGDQRELWPMIIEKAYAQYKGGYNDIGSGGQSGDVMSALTGKDSDSDGGRNLEKWFGWGISFDKIADAWERGDAMTASTPDGGKGKLYDEDKIVGNHAYYVTNVDREKQTITVRNPWGWGTGEVTMTYEEFKSHFYGLTTNPTK